ncbi:MAG: hypothetical protein HOV79_21725 [Hamadaea sp.]|nr:hypothetical protein [Hamadaea sp.]
MPLTSSAIPGVAELRIGAGGAAVVGRTTGVTTGSGLGDVLVDALGSTVASTAEGADVGAAAAAAGGPSPPPLARSPAVVAPRTTAARAPATPAGISHRPLPASE